MAAYSEKNIEILWYKLKENYSLNPFNAIASETKIDVILYKRLMIRWLTFSISFIMFYITI